jgi:hypothetical protein
VARAFEDQQPRAGDLLLHRARMVERENWIVRAVDHQGRRMDLAEPVARRRADVHHEVVHLARRDVRRAIELASDETPRRFVEVRGGPREDPQQADDVVDRRFAS